MDAQAAPHLSCVACHHDDAWEALLAAALSVRPRLTATIDHAVSHALLLDQAEPAEVCIALAHAIATHAARARDPEALLCAAFRAAAFLAGSTRGLGHLEGTP